MLYVGKEIFLLDILKEFGKTSLNLNLSEINSHFTLFVLMNCPIHIDTVSMELSNLYFKGLQVKISIK